jgi:DNA replication initiation complex subunit (GINS family)
MGQDREKVREYEKVRQVTQDIIISRLKKIVFLASAPAQTQQILENLTSEERFLYEEVHKLVSQWQADILMKEEGEN